MSLKKFKEYPSVVLKTEEWEGQKLDFDKIFASKGAIHIEIGSGKGTFIVEQAKAQPDVNFIGIEWANKFYRFAVDRIGRWGIENVRMVRTEAGKFLAEFVVDESVDCFHIYFPDPWPKKRHNKRRLFSDATIQQIIRCLKHGGVIKLATDHQKYFQQIQKVLEGNKGVLEEVDFEPAAGAKDGEVVGTNYERKYIKENRPVYKIAVKKI